MATPCHPQRGYQDQGQGRECYVSTGKEGPTTPEATATARTPPVPPSRPWPGTVSSNNISVRQQRNRSNQMNAPGASPNQHHHPPTMPLPPNAAPAPTRPPWPGFSKNGVLSLSLGMTANNPTRHRPLFSVIPPFILGSPISSVGNQIPCGAANTSRIKESPRNVFASGAAQPPTPQLAQESPPVDLDNVTGNIPQLPATHHRTLPARVPSI